MYTVYTWLVVTSNEFQLDETRQFDLTTLPCFQHYLLLIRPNIAKQEQLGPRWHFKKRHPKNKSKDNRKKKRKSS